MKPWISGPEELLKHAIDHMLNGSAFDFRVALISIDNSVELMIKTYLGLPKRIRKTEGPSRKQLNDSSFSFPDLLDLLEKYASDKIDNIELGDIEWYHRLRNTLYHEGNGITVDKDKVDGYLQIATILYNILFEEDFDRNLEFEPNSLVGQIVVRFSELENKIRYLYEKNFPDSDSKKIPFRKAIGELNKISAIDDQTVKQIDSIYSVRNESVHNAGILNKKAIISATDSITDIITKIMSLSM